MEHVSITSHPILPEHLSQRLRKNKSVGAFIAFEGWVRHENEGKKVLNLTYEAHVSMAEKEIRKITQEAKQKFEIEEVLVSHRIGKLKIGDIAVWIGVTGAHRNPCYEASKYVIDELKQRVPIWKFETYDDKKSSKWL